MSRVAAVVVTYNRLGILKKCIKALLDQTYACDILLINNASTDQTEEYILELRQIYQQIYYCNTGKNLGGAGGFCYGMKWAVELGFDFIWVMDDDCIPQNTALECFMNFAHQHENEKYGFLSSLALWKDGSVCRMNIQRKTVFRAVSRFNKRAISIKLASFVSLFVPAKIIKENGLPISDFYIWSDDWEFTRRLSRKYPCYLLTDSIVWHLTQANIGANIAFDSVERLSRYMYLYRNDMMLYRREGIYGYIYYVLKCFYNLIQIIFLSKQYRLKRIKIMLEGIKAGINFNPAIRYP